MIDDDDEDFILLQHAFQLQGRSVTVNWFDSPQAFLESNHWQQRPIHLLVLDLNLGAEGGKHWHQEFLRHECCQGLPIVIYSGSEASGDRQEMMELGAADFISKVAAPELMKTVVDRMVAQMT